MSPESSVSPVMGQPQTYVYAFTGWLISLRITLQTKPQRLEHVNNVSLNLHVFY